MSISIYNLNNNIPNTHLEYSSFNNNIFKSIDSILLSLDSLNLIFNNNNDNNDLYYLIQFNNYFKFSNLIKIISSLIPVEVNFSITLICTKYNIITFNVNNEIILTLHLYSMSVLEYVTEFTESNFDCNLIYRSYNGYNIMHLFHSNIKITYDDTLKRICNKKFCYISNNLENFDEFILNNSDFIFIKSISSIINKFTYAIKLIHNGWIMDEYVLKKKSWTINYWENYKNYLNIIKFENNCNLYNYCKICKESFLEKNIVFNKNNEFVHYECLFTKLYED
jgi:hypothetical protein